MLRAFVVAGFVIGSVSAASAADRYKAPYAPMPAPMPVSDWTAFYVGGFAGGSRVTETYCSPAGVCPPHVSGSGFVGGVYIGYDYELPNRFVVGARISAPFGSIAKNTPAGFPGAPVGAQASATFEWAATVSAIFGYDMGLWMPYLGAGVAFGAQKATFTVPPVTNSDIQQHTGLNVLAGLKYALSRNWAIGVQYNYMTFGSQTYNFGPVIGAGTASMYQNSVVATLDYRF
jgi:outer membrane immunogenic protein